MILDRQAPFDLDAVAVHLKPAGYFIAQQVGERNMACVRAALGQEITRPPVQRQAFTARTCPTSSAAGCAPWQTGMWPQPPPGHPDHRPGAAAVTAQTVWFRTQA